MTHEPLPESGSGVRRLAYAPVVIGGVGGSGTRVVAGALSACGLELLGRTNRTLDSEWAIMLFKRPRWPRLMLGADRPLSELVESYLVLRTMFAGRRLDHDQLSLLAAAAAECAWLGQLQQPSDAIRWWAPQVPFRIVGDYLAQPPAPAEDVRWGFKQPGSQVMLPEIAAAFPGVRVVHVVRHPLDMAWSDNSQGVRLWGPLFGMTPAKIDRSVQNAQLAWWLYSTSAAAQQRASLGDRWLQVHLEQLCADPVTGVTVLANFAGLHPDEETVRRAARTITPMEPIGRWRAHGLDGFDQALLEEARATVNGWEEAQLEWF